MSDNPEETAYYLRIVLLFIDVATETVLKALYSLIPDQDLGTFLSSIDIRKKVFKLHKDKVITKVQCNLVTAHVPDAKQFDISLLIAILINTNLLHAPAKGWEENRPCNSDLSLSADLLRLRSIRNSIVAHKPRAALYKVKFEKLWKELREILVRISENTAHGTAEEIEKRIDSYRKKSLDAYDESKCREKLDEWWENCEEISRLQEKVEELVTKCNEFTLFFKETPEKYCRYVRLLFEGGRLVLSNILNRGLSEKGQDLSGVLLSNRDLLESSIDNQDFIRQVFPTDEADSMKANVDINTWDITVLAVVIEATIKPKNLKEIKILKDARTNYADTALMVTVDNDGFSVCCEDLVYSLRTLSSTLDEEIQIGCEELIKRYRSRLTEDKVTDCDDYFKQLKSHGEEIKCLSDHYKETCEKLKETIRQMNDAGVCFKKEHVLELKMVTLGESSEKKNFAEETLLTVWEAALRMSENPDNFNAVKREADKILEDIRAIPDVKVTGIKRHCVVFSISCFTSQALLEVIDYLTGEIFKTHVVSLSTELGYLCDEVIFIEGNVTFESLNKILANPQGCVDTSEEGLSLAIECSSPEGMQNILKLLGSEKITNNINKIADSLSSHVEETVTLKIIPELKGLSGVFEETDNETTSSSESQSDENEYLDRYHGKKPRGHPEEKVKADEEKLWHSESNLKEAFKKDLISLYRRKHTSLPLGLIIEDIDKPLEKLYVPPYPLYDMEIHAMKNKTPVNTLHELFVTEGNACKNIYLTAETGIGKTAFVKWLTLGWCQAHSYGEEMTNTCIRESTDEMKQFDFLFHVSVGEFEVNKYHVDHLIYNNIVSRLEGANKYDMKFLETIFEQAKCLIILDGVDENISQTVTCAIPERITRDRTSTLNTCTTWAYERLRLNSSEVDKHVRIEPLGSNTSDMLSMNIISLFSEETTGISEDSFSVIFSARLASGTGHACRKFKKILREKKISHFMSSPVLLAHLLSLWILEEKIDGSQCEIYTKLLLMLVTRGSLNDAYAERLTRLQTHDMPVSECLESFSPYHRLFLSLGHLAFDTLCSSPSERHLIFNEREAEKILSSDDSVPPFDILEAGFITGILCKQNPSEYLCKTYSISFIHPFVHEFFAALYMGSVFSHSDTIKHLKAACTSITPVLALRGVFTFLSGFNEELLKDVSMHMQRLISTDELIQKYRSTVNTERIEQIKNIQDMVVSCVEESRNSGRGKIQLPLEDVVLDFSCEDESYETYLRKIFRRNRTNVRSLRVEDSVCRRILLLDEFEPCQLQKISIEGVSVLQNNPCITEFKTLRYIHVENVIFKSSPSSWDIMLALIRLPLVEALGLVNIHLTHEQFSLILQYFDQKTDIKQIVLRSIRCTDHESNCTGLVLNLSRHQQLRLLEIEEVPLTNIQVNPESLVHCKVRPLPGYTTSSLFHHLEKASNMKSMICKDLEANSDINALANVLPRFENIVYLKLSSIDLGERLIHLPSELKQLEQVKMFHVEMSIKTLLKLIESIQGCGQPVAIELRKCSVKPKTEFEVIKGNIRSSSAFAILEDIKGEIFRFKTNP